MLIRVERHCYSIFWHLWSFRRDLVSREGSSSATKLGTISSIEHLVLEVLPHDFGTLDLPCLTTSDFLDLSAGRGGCSSLCFSAALGVLQFSIERPTCQCLGLASFGELKRLDKPAVDDSRFLAALAFAAFCR